MTLALTMLSPATALACSPIKVFSVYSIRTQRRCLPTKFSGVQTGLSNCAYGTQTTKRYTSDHRSPLRSVTMTLKV